MKALLIGSANSARVVLERLVAHGVEVVTVFGQVDESGNPPPGRADLAAAAKEAGVPFRPFVRIADRIEEVERLSADIAFVVGFSQIVDPRAFRHVRLGAIGFHPTRLPQGRGRAPLAWLALGEVPGAASFFRLGDGADDGDLIVQEPFEVAGDDTATSLSAKVAAAAERALDDWLPDLERRVLEAVRQDADQASWLGVRRAEDGRIDWTDSAEAVVALVRASASPYPGAFTHCDHRKLIVERAEVAELPVRGVPGRVVEVDGDGSFLVAAGGRALVRVRRWRGEPDDVRVRTGTRLGLDAEIAVVALRDEVRELRARLSVLERRLD